MNREFSISGYVVEFEPDAGRMIERVIGLQKDGIELPQFFLLTFRYANKGEGYKQTIESGTEVYLRGLLRNGGIAGPVIDNLFANAH